MTGHVTIRRITIDPDHEAITVTSTDGENYGIIIRHEHAWIPLYAGSPIPGTPCASESEAVGALALAAGDYQTWQNTRDGEIPA